MMLGVDDSPGGKFRKPSGLGTALSHTGPYSFLPHCVWVVTCHLLTPGHTPLWACPPWGCLFWRLPCLTEGSDCLGSHSLLDPLGTACPSVAMDKAFGLGAGPGSAWSSEFLGGTEVGIPNMVAPCACTHCCVACWTLAGDVGWAPLESTWQACALGSALAPTDPPFYTL